MESADQGAPTGRYSVVVPNPSLRLVLRGTGATFEALDAHDAEMVKEELRPLVFEEVRLQVDF